jgi:uncharacterized repeat protein (TIGR02543 family)
MTDGVWTVYSHQPFQSEEWMKVNLDGYEYTIKVTDPEQFAVYFEMNGHGTKNLPNPNPQYVEKGQKATKPEPNPEDENYRFSPTNWYADEELTKLFNFNTEITQDTTIYARWQSIVTYDPKPGTVTYGGTTYGPGQKQSALKQYVTVNKTATNHTPDNLEGYTFDKWYIDELFETPFDFNTPITKDTTLYAKYNKIIHIIEEESGKTADGGYALAFDLDYETYKDNAKVYVDGAELSSGQYTLAKDDKGYTVATLTKDYISTLSDGTHDMEVETLAGNVEKSFSTASGKVEDDCLVSYLNKVEGATLWPADGKVSAGTVLEKVIPSASGYRFVDWYSDESLTTPFDFTKAIFTDTKIYAKWVKTWDVTITTDHGTVPGSDQQIVTRTVDDGSKVAALNDLSWIGYKWGGWYSGESKYDFNKDIHADTIIYAYWIPDFKITDGNGGTAHYGSTYAFTLNYYYPDWNKTTRAVFRLMFPLPKEEAVIAPLPTESSM